MFKFRFITKIMVNLYHTLVWINKLNLLKNLKQKMLIFGQKNLRIKDIINHIYF